MRTLLVLALALLCPCAAAFQSLLGYSKRKLSSLAFQSSIAPQWAEERIRNLLDESVLLSQESSDLPFGIQKQVDTLVLDISNALYERESPTKGPQQLLLQDISRRLDQAVQEASRNSGEVYTKKVESLAVQYYQVQQLQQESDPTVEFSQRLEALQHLVHVHQSGAIDTASPAFLTSSTAEEETVNDKKKTKEKKKTLLPMATLGQKVKEAMSDLSQTLRGAVTKKSEKDQVAVAKEGQRDQVDVAKEEKVVAAEKEQVVAAAESKKEVTATKKEVTVTQETEKDQMDAVKESLKEQVATANEATKEPVAAAKEATKEQVTAAKEATKEQVTAKKKTTKEQVTAAVKKSAKNQTIVAKEQSANNQTIVAKETAKDQVVVPKTDEKAHGKNDQKDAAKKDQVLAPRNGQVVPKNKVEVSILSNGLKSDMGWPTGNRASMPVSGSRVVTTETRPSSIPANNSKAREKVAASAVSQEAREKVAANAAPPAATKATSSQTKKATVSSARQRVAMAYPSRFREVISGSDANVGIPPRLREPSLRPDAPPLPTVHTAAVQRPTAREGFLSKLSSSRKNSQRMMASAAGHHDHEKVSTSHSSDAPIVSPAWRSRTMTRTSATNASSLRRTPQDERGRHLPPSATSGRQWWEGF